MPSRPQVPGVGGLGGPTASQQYQDMVLGFGGVDTGLGGARMPAGGAAAMYQTAQSQEVQVVRDDALVALIGGLREDFARFIDMQKHFNVDKQNEISQVREQLRQTRQDLQGQQVAGASGLGAAALGAATAGYTTSTGQHNPKLSMQAVQQQIVGPQGFMNQSQMLPLTMGFSRTHWLNPNQMPFSSFMPANIGYSPQQAAMAAVAGLTMLPPSGMPSGVGGQMGPAPRSAGGGGGGFRQVPAAFGGGGVQGGGIFGGGGGGGGAGGGAGGPQKPYDPKATKAFSPMGLYEEYLSQRAKNERFQEIEGGSNLHAFKDRFDESFHRFGHLSMSGGDYKKAYEGATAIGYRGQTRAQAVTAINHWKNMYGMSPDDGLKLLDQNARTANVSFQQLNQSLKETTIAARTFGINAKMARDMLLNNSNAAYQAGFGSGSNQIGTTLTAEAVGGGRQMAGVNYAGMLGPTQQALQAAQMGVSMNQFYTKAQSDPAFLAKSQDKLLNMQIQGLVPQEVQAFIKQAVAQVGGGQALLRNPGLAQSIADQIPAHMSQPVEFVVQAWNAVNRTNMTVNQMLLTWVQQIGGATLSAKQSFAAQKAGKPTSAGTYDAHTQAGAAEVSQFTKSNKHGDDKIMGLFPTHHSPNAAAGAYEDLVKHTGRGSGALEALAGAVGKSDDQVVVSTSKGPRYMKLSDAITNYPNEVATGAITFMTGSNKGKSGLQVAGMADTSTATSAAATKEANDASKIASLDKNKTEHDAGWWDRHHKDDGGDAKKAKNAVSVTLDLTPAAQRLVQQLQPGANPGDATGAPLPLNTGGAGSYYPAGP